MSSPTNLFKMKLFYPICYKTIVYHLFNKRSFGNYCLANKLGIKSLNKVPNKVPNKVSSRFLSLESTVKEKSTKRSTPYMIKTPTNILKIDFVDNENQMAFSFVELNLSQQKFKLNEENPVFDPTTEELVDEFIRIDHTHYENHSPLALQLCKLLNTMSEKQLSDLLESMKKWEVTNSPFSRLFFKMWSNIDRELENRLNKISFADNNEVLPWLHFGNMFYKLHKVANITKFNNLLVTKLCCPDFQLNKTSLLHLMFYMNLHRKIDKNILSFVLKQCNDLMKVMNLNEIGVICMSFFKCEIKIGEDLAKLVIFKTLTDISKETPSIIKTAIIKSIRRSVNARIEPNVKPFVDEIKKLQNNNEFALTHLLTLAANSHLFDPQLMSDVFEKLCSNPSSFRIKDIERIFYCFAYYNHHLDEHKLEVLFNDLHKNSVSFFLYDFPFCLLNLLHYSSILGFYPKPLIERCFEQNFLGKIIRNSRLDFQRHLLSLNTSLSVEKYDEYQNILVPPQKVYRYHKWVLSSEKSNLSSKLPKRMNLINSVYMTLKSEFNKRVQLCHIFPFKSYPFVVLWKKPQKRLFSLSENTKLLSNMFEDCIVIYILDIQDFAVIDTLIEGRVHFEIRLLKAMGCKVVTIPWHHLTQYNTSRARRDKVMSYVYNVDPDFS